MKPEDVKPKICPEHACILTGLLHIDIKDDEIFVNKEEIIKLLGELK